MTDKPVKVPKFEDLEFDGDINVDLEKEVILSSTGERIDQAYVDQAVAEVHAARRKRGRPSRSGEAGTSPTLRIRVSEDEKADIEEQAELRGITVSEYVRWSIELAEATAKADAGDADAMHDLISLKVRAVNQKGKVRGGHPEGTTAADAHAGHGAWMLLYDTGDIDVTAIKGIAATMLKATSDKDGYHKVISDVISASGGIWKLSNEASRMDVTIFDALGKATDAAKSAPHKPS